MQDLYSIWLVPSPEVKEILDTVIMDLSQKYNGPVFEPHLTLLGDVSISKEEMIEKAHEVAKRLKPFMLSFGEISFSTTYFQNVFVRATATSSLMNANLAAKEIFERDNTLFMPHTSLFYGDQTIEEREKITADVVLPENLTCMVDKLVIIPSTKDPREWIHIAEIPFG